MSWAVFALSSAVLDTLYYLIVKRLGGKIHYSVLASGTLLINAIILGVAASSYGIPDLGNLFWPAVIGSAIINILAITLYFTVIPKTDLSLSIPMLSFTPVFLLVTSFALLYEIPSLGGLLGILLIVVGSYVLNLHHFDRHILAPFHELFRNPGTRGMLTVAILFSFTVSLDKLIIIESNPFFGSFVISLLVSMTFFVMSILSEKTTAATYRKSLPAILLLGLIGAGSAIAFNLVNLNLSVIFS